LLWEAFWLYNQYISARGKRVEPGSGIGPGRHTKP
jgi:hypothetical protein